MLAWISDRDGRPRAWVAPLPPDGSAGRRAGLAAAHGRRQPDGRPCPVGRAEDRLVARRLLARLPARPRRGRAHPRPARHPGRHPGPRPRPERPGGHAGLLVAQRAPARHHDLRRRDAATVWRASSTCATGRRRCSPPAPRRWSARSAATACAPWSASAAAAPAGWSCSTCAAGGAPSCSPAARRTSPTPASGSPAASCSCTPTPVASGPRCWPSGSTATPSRRCRTSSPAATTHDLDLVALDPAGARAALVWNVDGRSEVELLDLRSGITEPLPRPPGDVVTGAAFTRDGRALLVGNEGPTVPPTITRIALDAVIDRCGRPASRMAVVADPATPLLPAAPRDAGHLVDPVLHHFPGEDGLPLSGWLFRPASAFGAVPDPHLAARRPGGPGTPDLPAAVPGAARRGRRGVRAERPRLRRVRPHVLPGRRPGPAVRRDHRRARRGHVAGRARAWPTRPGSACPAGRTAAT